ncbi:interleukin-6 receptor subunit beta-like isoform X1 [Acipenser ruthenus]|uniref:interleukin-6 receptor subunit beta-like isoform X1 n=1 Tax=Acipenser ruthenus TaxID=7906 RepID=UPI0027410845|nr:interleukin-6 receptor subunit beta-like isoform X1 [Acipenser ruthenus]XP_058871158.1 interleukin-6 receptor subunit beta-like isoform X1 [Acipenser ruthenus]
MVSVQKHWERGWLYPLLWLTLKAAFLFLGAESSWQDCSTLTVRPPVARPGSAVSASCVLSPACARERGVNAADVAWRLDGEEVPRDQYGSIGSTVSTVTLPALPLAGANLSCHARYGGSDTLLQSREIRVASAPAQPKILSCISIHLANLSCSWDPGPETLLRTSFTLSVMEVMRRCGSKFKDPLECRAAPGARSCPVPAKNLYASYNVTVRAENELGNQTSPVLCLYGMDAVKLSPPRVVSVSAVAGREDCLAVIWDLHYSEIYDASSALYELQYRARGEKLWKQSLIDVREASPVPVRLCDLPAFTEYTFRLRSRYKSDMSHWSEWSNKGEARTPERAPSKEPQLWRRIEPLDSEGERLVTLLWKPLQRHEANGRILGYRVFRQHPGTPEKTELSECGGTTPLASPECSVLLSAERCVLSLSAYSSAGQSPQASIAISAAGQAALPGLSTLAASPADDHSLLVQWKPPERPSVSGFILEWCVLSEREGCVLHWHRLPRHSRDAVISESIEPERLYRVSAYVLDEGEAGDPVSVQAYSRQGAPSRGPLLRPKTTWKTGLQLEWDPIPLDDRRGFIQNYTIFYQSEGGVSDFVVVNGSVHQLRLDGLSSDQEYKLHAVASTDQGGAAGPGIYVQTLRDDGTMLLVIPLSALLTLISIIMLLACVQQRQAIKKHFFPTIPDPADSSLANWMPKKIWMDFRDYQGDRCLKAQVDISAPRPGTVQETLSSLSRPECQDPASLGGGVTIPFQTYCTAAILQHCTGEDYVRETPGRSCAEQGSVKYSTVMGIAGGYTQIPQAKLALLPCNPDLRVQTPSQDLFNKTYQSLLYPDMKDPDQGIEEEEEGSISMSPLLLEQLMQGRAQNSGL